VLLLLLAASLVVASCGGESADTFERRILVVGIDGLEWDVMAPLLESGRLPTFERLMREGSWGELVSLEVLESPVIWTSIATGKTPEKHGITGFAKRSAGGADVPMTSNVRRVEAIWEILGDRGRSVGVVGWLATWPATPVNGYLVSSYFNYGANAEGRAAEAVTYPPALADSLAPFLLGPDDIPDGSAAAFLRGGPPQNEAARRRFDALKVSLATDETTREVALHLGRSFPTDLTAVYFRGVDGPSHFFWVDMLPDTGPGATAEDAEVFGEVVPLYYEYMDGVLAEMLGLADDETTVIVTSDHGHSGPKLNGDRYEWGIAMHDRTGFVCLWGKDIEAGVKLDRPSVLDLTPTMLALCGLPVAEDMDGRVLDEAIDPAFLAAHPVGTVDTYETGSRGESDEPIESAVDEEIRERLRSLGYIE
jgi:predicted AlkP superfamily phosphohydrolase/phosphomutase